MAQHTPVTADPQEIQRAHAMWANFVQAMKWSVVVTVAVLALLAAAFINW